MFSVQQPEWLRACVESHANQMASWVSTMQAFSAQDHDFIIVDMPSLSEAGEQEILNSIDPERTNCLVVYKFAARNQLRNLAAHGFRLLKGPLEPYALVNLLRDQVSLTSADAERAHDKFESCDCLDQANELVRSIRRLQISLEGYSPHHRLAELC